MEQELFPQEPAIRHSLSLLEKQSEVVAGLGLKALKARDAQQVMEAAVEAVAGTLDNDLCKVLELLPDKKALLLRAGVGWQPGLVGHGTVSAGLESQAGYTLMEGGPVVVEDMASEKRFDGPPLLHNHGVVSGMSTPIYTSRGPWGVIGTHRTQSASYSRHDQDFLVAVANVLGAAIERERYEQELNATRKRLEHWDQMRARFVHNVAHELRTPLTPLMIRLQGLSRMTDGMAPEAAQNVEVAQRNAQRLQDMVDDFVELTRLQVEAQPLERQRVDLAAVARAVAQDYKPRYQQQEVSLRLEVEDQVLVEGDQAMLERAVAAFVDNALKFTSAGAGVRLAVGRSGDFGQVTIDDEGAGLEPEQAQALFQPLTQAVLKEQPTGGLGIGLAIAKQIIDLHGGRVGVESPGAGLGTRFWFTVRLVAGERLTEHAKSPAASS